MTGIPGFEIAIPGCGDRAVRSGAPAGAERPRIVHSM